MARVSSNKVRQYIYVVGAGLEEEFNPEHIELYMEDGSPLNIDATDRMRWRGEWSEDAIYQRNDVVTDDDKLYILIVSEYGPSEFFPGEDPEFWELILVNGVEGALIWRGAWNAGTAYEVNDAVTYNGSTYRRKTNGTSAGTPDVDVTNWEMIGGGGTGSSVTWKGAWVAATAYAVNDAVTYNGASYVRKVAGTTATAPNADLVNWQVLIGGAPTTALDSWHVVGTAGEPVFQNNWVNYGGIEPPLAFRKGSDGRVRFRGTIKGGVSASIVFTLPVGYWPPAPTTIPITTSGGNALTYISVATNGAVNVGTVGTVGQPTWVDGVEFDTDTVSQVQSLGPQLLDPWHQVGTAGEPVFQNGWVNYSIAAPGGEETVAFRKLPNGRVSLRGLVKNGSAGTIFTLPVGYRPPKAVRFAMWAYNASVMGIGVGSVDTLGVVNISNSPFNPMAVNGWIDLAPIEFDTDTVLNMTMVGQQSMDPWHVVNTPGEPQFQNSWANDPGTTARFRKYPSGEVRLAGRVDTGNLGTTIFTLPVGYRPTQDVVFPAASYKSGSGNVASEVRVIAATGAVQGFQGDSVTNPGAYISLDGLKFDTDSIQYVQAAVLKIPVIEPADPLHVIKEGGANVVASNPATITGSSGIVSVTRTAAGTFRVVTSVAAMSANHLWPRAQVADNGPWIAQCVTRSPTEYDLYVCTPAGVLTDGRTVYTDYKARVA